MKDAFIAITIEYLMMNDEQLYRIELTPNEYYDQNYVDEHDKYCDMIPLFDMPIDYISDVHKKYVVLTKLSIVDNNCKEEQITHFWGAQKNWVCECFDNEGEGRHELIVSTNLSMPSSFSETLRFEFNGEHIVPRHHSIYYTGKEDSDTLFDTPRNDILEKFRLTLENPAKIKNGEVKEGIKRTHCGMQVDQR